MAAHNDLGKKGEEIAERFLIKNNFQILAKNWRYKQLEIDIIALHKNILVIIEVKTRRTDITVSLDEIINRKKQRFLIEAANAYVLAHNINKEVRFDFVLIIIKNNKYYLKHIPDAFSPI